MTTLGQCYGGEGDSRSWRRRYRSAAGKEDRSVASSESLDDDNGRKVVTRKNWDSDQSLDEDDDGRKATTRKNWDSDENWGGDLWWRAMRRRRLPGRTAAEDSRWVRDGGGRISAGWRHRSLQLSCLCRLKTMNKLFLFREMEIRVLGLGWVAPIPCQHKDLEERKRGLRYPLSTIFVDTKNLKSTPNPILPLIQLVYQYNSTRYTIHIL